LEIPVSVNVGNVEVTAGSINLYEITGKIAEKVFNGSAMAAALAPANSYHTDAQTPSSHLVSDEESQRRQIAASLSDTDLMELEQIAPQLFAG
jgi:hypothetical protein